MNHRLSVAPMMDYTDRFCRYFLRLISKHTLLYTEMVTTAALIHGDRNRHLRFHESEHPLALQLGGSNPVELALCSQFAERAGYDEVNLNCGCPSDRVQSGEFGACLMKSPRRVAECIGAMLDAVTIPVTVKHRIGVDDRDSPAELVDFVGTVAETGCRTFIVHARKAWLRGLSPKQNREVPPLDYDLVYRLKREFPELEIIINGGVKSLEEADRHLDHVDGVMIGREAYHNPYMLADADRFIFGSGEERKSRVEILQEFAPFVAAEIARGTRFSHMTRHVIGLFQGQPGARKFRRYISEHAHLGGAGIEVFDRALENMSKGLTVSD